LNTITHSNSKTVNLFIFCVQQTLNLPIGLENEAKPLVYDFNQVKTNKKTLYSQDAMSGDKFYQISSHRISKKERNCKDSRK